MEKMELKQAEINKQLEELELRKIQLEEKEKELLEREKASKDLEKQQKEINEQIELIELSEIELKEKERALLEREKATQELELEKELIHSEYETKLEQLKKKEVILEEKYLEEYKLKVKELEQKENIIKSRETSVARLEKLKQDLNNEHQNKLKELEQQELNLISEKANKIASLNNEIQKTKTEMANLNHQLIEEKAKLEQEKSLIAVKLSEYEHSKLAEIESKMSSHLEKRIEEIQNQYKQYFDQTLNTVRWSEDQLKAAFDEINEAIVAMIKTKEEIMDIKLKDLETAKAEYKDAIIVIQNIEETKAELDVRDKKLTIKERMLDRYVDEEIKKKYEELIDDNNRSRQLLDDYKDKYNELSLKHDENVNVLLQSENLDAIQLKNERDRLINKLEEYEKLYREYTHDELEDLKLQAAQVDTIKSINNKLKSENESLTRKVINLEAEMSLNDSLKYKNQVLESQIKTERLLMQHLQTEIENLSSRVENRKSSIIASESIETPITEFMDAENDTATKLVEIEWLNTIMNSCEDAGFIFSKRLYYSFHTSLKTSDMSPLTVLAGVSGTGKSKLPQLFSKYGGLHFLSIPVKPDWDSPQSLFGYYNSIEKRFDATSLLRALVMFQQNESISETKDKIVDLSDRVLIVLLDEMNLAHIEQYFSDLLSKLEERRGETKKISFEVDLGAGNENYSIFLTDNVKWVGTMNEDETTKSLSDKVIDRGNIISFPRPESFVRYNASNKIVPNRKMIHRTVWENWVDEKIVLTDIEANKYMGIVESINGSLKNVNRALGHRVWQSIESYIISHPLVTSLKDDKSGKREIALSYAFEEALVHKVMPKLRGISTDGIQREFCLEKIKDVLVANSFTIVNDFEVAMNSVTGTFIWDSAMYLNDEYSKIK